MSDKVVLEYIRKVRAFVSRRFPGRAIVRIHLRSYCVFVVHLASELWYCGDDYNVVIASGRSWHNPDLQLYVSRFLAAWYKRQESPPDLCVLEAVHSA